MIHQGHADVFAYSGQELQHVLGQSSGFERFDQLGRKSMAFVRAGLNKTQLPVTRAAVTMPGWESQREVPRRTTTPTPRGR